MTRAFRLTVGLPAYLALWLACSLAQLVEDLLNVLFPLADRAEIRLRAWMEPRP